MHDNNKPKPKMYPQTLLEAREEIAGTWQILASFLAKGRLEGSYSCIFILGQVKEIQAVSGKLLEGIPGDKTYQHLDMRGLIRVSQHGVMHAKSCLTNLMELILRRHQEVGRAVNIVFNKPFDKVLHDRLVRRLDHMGSRVS